MPSPPTIDLGSGIDVQDTINKLIEVERQPLRRFLRDNTKHEHEIRAWETLNSHTKKLAALSRDLRSVTSPFHLRVLESEAPEAISGTVRNNAPTSEKKIRVKALASHHELHSKPIPEKKKLPAGRFVLSQKIEKEDLKLNFGGGSLKQLVDFLNEHGDGRIEADQADAGNNEKIIRLRSRKSGAAAQIHFEDPQGVLRQAGLLEKKRSQSGIDFDPAQISIVGYAGRVRYKVKEEGKKLELSQGSLKYQLKQAYIVKKGDNLRMRVHALQVPQPSDEDFTGPSILQELDIGPDISVNVKGVELKGKKVKRSRRVPFQSSRQGPPRLRLRVNVLYEYEGKHKQRSFFASLRESAVKKWKIPLTKLPRGAEIYALQTYADGKAIFSDAYFESPEQLLPSHESKAAQDAILEVDGLTLKRPTNNGLENILSGASIDLKDLTPKPVTVKVRADEAKILKQLKEWANSYNTMMAFLRENTRAAKITEASTSDVDNKKRDRGGVFVGDNTTRQLVTQGQTVIASSYPKKIAGFAVLANIGISTGKIGSRWEEIQYGLLQVDEE